MSLCAARRTSASVVPRPSVRRTVPRASREGTFIATTTAGASSWPAWQAEPVDAATGGGGFEERRAGDAREADAEGVGQALRRLAVQREAGDSVAQLLPEPVAQDAHARGFGGEVETGPLTRRAQPDDGCDVLGYTL